MSLADLTCGTGMSESAYFVVINFSTTLPTSCNTKSRCSHPKQSAQSLGTDFSIASWRTLLYEAVKSNGVDKKTQDCSTLSLLWQSKLCHTVQTRINRTNANLHIKGAIWISKRFDTLKHIAFYHQSKRLWAASIHTSEPYTKQYSLDALHDHEQINKTLWW